MSRATDSLINTLLPHYVYELRDPRNNAVFYVGKGTRNRVDAHDICDIDEADDAQGGLVSSPKEEQIRSIKRVLPDGPLRVIIGRYESSAEAFAVETMLIKWVYGIEQLTNLVHGHRHRSTRPHAQQAKWRDGYSHIDGIDRLRQMSGSHDGKFTEEQRCKAIKNHIGYKLEALQDDMQALFNGTQIEVSAPDLSTPQDCQVRVIKFSKSVQLVLKMQLTGKHIRVYCVPVSTSSTDVARFRTTLQEKVPGLEVMNRGRQAQIGSYIEQQLPEGQRSQNRHGIAVKDSEKIRLVIREAVKLLT